MADGGCGIVDRAGELIRVEAVPAFENEVPAVGTQCELLAAHETVFKTIGPILGYPDADAGLGRGWVNTRCAVCDAVAIGGQ